MTIHRVHELKILSPTLHPDCNQRSANVHFLFFPTLPLVIDFEKLMNSFVMALSNGNLAISATEHSLELCTMALNLYAVLSRAPQLR